MQNRHAQNAATSIDDAKLGYPAFYNHLIVPDTRRPNVMKTVREKVLFCWADVTLAKALCMPSTAPLLQAEVWVEPIASRGIMFGILHRKARRPYDARFAEQLGAAYLGVGACLESVTPESFA